MSLPPSRTIRFGFSRHLPLSWAVVGLLVAGLLLPQGALAQPADLQARSEQGARAMSAGRFEEAARIYRSILEALPDEPGILMNLGMSLAMSGRERDAIEPLTRAATLKPSLLPAHMFLGSSYLALGQPGQAVAPLTRVVTATPADLDARHLLGRALLLTGKPAAAVEQFQRLTALAPKVPEAWFGLGQAYAALSQEALDTFEAEPEDSPWRSLMIADALAADGRVGDAFELYRAASARLPAMPSIHDAVAKIYDRTAHKDWAATERARGAAMTLDCVKRKAQCEFRAGRLRSALAAATGADDAESRYWRARAASELALAAFTTLDTLPDSRERREFRTELARSQGRHADAVREIEAALALAPGDPALLTELARSHYALRDYDRAGAIAGELLEKAPDVPGLLALRGEALLQLQRLDEAVPLLERAVAADPRDPSARASLGRASVQQGKFDRAIPLLEPLLASDEDGSLHLQLARAYQGTGQKEKAMPLLEKARELQQAAQARTAGAAEAKIAPP